MATGAMGAVVNEQQRIIFKWALKINCVVLLTQSPRCCMVNSERPGFHRCPVGIWQALGFLIASRLHFRFYLRFQQANHSEPNACDTASTSMPAAHLSSQMAKANHVRRRSSVLIIKKKKWEKLGLFFIRRKLTNTLWNYIFFFTTFYCLFLLPLLKNSLWVRDEWEIVESVKRVWPW